MDQLTNTLSDFIFVQLRKSTGPESKSLAGGLGRGRESNLKPQSQQIAAELVKEALASGMPLQATELTDNPLKGGNTAEFVGILSLRAPFVLKMDNASKKLANEGLAIRTIKNNTNLSQNFRDAWPMVYAVRTQPPYAYLMEVFPKEDGWISLEDRLFPVGKVQTLEHNQVSMLINGVLDILLDGYQGSLDRRYHPSLIEDYVNRIIERLKKTANEDARFASKGIMVNGEQLQPWEKYVELLSQNSAYLAKISAPFTTVVHGDPNPGNLMLRVTDTRVELKLIDPKEWISGDYLFDICKITHFLEGTGPAEKPADGVPVKASFTSEEKQNQLTYVINQPSWTVTLVNACQERTKDFAAKHGDRYWEKRYKLGMAANLLGLPLNRLDKGREDSALILYGEGLKWLHLFCCDMENDAANSVAGK